MSVLLLMTLVAATCDDSQLARASQLVAEYRPDEALPVLEDLIGRGHHCYEDHVALYEQLGIARAYLEDKEAAGRAFEMLLTLSPGHAIRYTLSPKAGFAFEAARREAAGRPPPQLDLSWPRGLTVTDPIPITVEVVADPRRFLKRAVVFTRTRGVGDESYSEHRLSLPAVGEYTRLLLVPPEPDATTHRVVELFVVGIDGVGNEVLRWGSRTHPRTISLTHVPPAPWYRRWWVWAIVGGVAAGATAVLMYDESSTFDSEFRWRR